MTEEPRCWACEGEPSVDGTLGVACRARLRAGEKDPAVPRLDVLMDRLADGYHRLCWNCEAEPTRDITGLCPPCRADLRG